MLMCWPGLQVEQLQQEVLAYLLSKDDNLLDSRNAIIEVPLLDSV